MAWSIKSILEIASVFGAPGAIISSGILYVRWFRQMNLRRFIVPTLLGIVGIALGVQAVGWGWVLLEKHPPAAPAHTATPAPLVAVAPPTPAQPTRINTVVKPERRSVPKGQPALPAVALPTSPPRSGTRTVGIYVGPEAIGHIDTNSKIRGTDTGIEDHGQGTRSESPDISGSPKGAASATARQSSPPGRSQWGAAIFIGPGVHANVRNVFIRDSDTGINDNGLTTIENADIDGASPPSNPNAPDKPK